MRNTNGTNSVKDSFNGQFTNNFGPKLDFNIDIFTVMTLMS